ncbi:MAG: hypothetical protein ACXABY_13625 [Candidatus Thorarchaeota archaeon]|jgi:hypothetical protein
MDIRSDKDGYSFAIGKEQVAELKFKTVTIIQEPKLVAFDGVEYTPMTAIVVWYVTYQKKKYTVKSVEHGIKLIKSLFYVYKADDHTNKFLQGANNNEL